METANEVKDIQNLAKEVKGDVKSLETKLDATQVEMQKSIDQLVAKVEKAAIGKAATEQKHDLASLLEAKSVDLKNYTKGAPRVEIKASGVDMLRTVAGKPQSLIGTGAMVSLPNKINHVRDFMRIGRLASPVYIYDEETARTGSPDLTAEGDLKPQFSFSFTQRTVTAVKIAGFYKVTTEFAKDLPALNYSLQGKGVEMLLNKEDYQLLYGTGADGQMPGLVTKATAFDAGTLRVKNAQNIDVIRAGVNQVRLSLYAANVVMMHPTDVATLELTKDTQGRYILPNILAGGAPSTVSRVQIAEIDQINPGSFLIGALDMAVDTFSVEDLSIQVYDQNQDDAVHNKLTVVLEERLLQAVTRPAALVKGTFADGIAQLSAAATPAA